MPKQVLYKHINSWIPAYWVPVYRLQGFGLRQVGEQRDSVKMGK